MFHEIYDIVSVLISVMYIYPCSDVEKIQAGIGNKLVLFITSSCTFLAEFIVAFIYSWKMALVMCGMLPLLVLLSALMAKVEHSLVFEVQFHLY